MSGTVAATGTDDGDREWKAGVCPSTSSGFAWCASACVTTASSRVKSKTFSEVSSCGQ